MALRTINYSVSLSGISPATQQFGGVQGEHNATQLVFKLDSDLLSNIKTQAGNNKVVYRFDVYDGAGGLTSTDSAPLTDSPPSYLLENKVSRMGGNVQVFLIITEIKDGETQMDLYSFPAVLRLKEKQEGEVSDAENYESISTLAEVAKKSASVAENSAAIAKEAQIKTEESKVALESGAEFIFLGGDSKSAVDVSLAVDGELSEVSTNPVQNKVLDAEVKGINEQHSNLKTQFEASLIEEGSTDDGWRYIKFPNGSFIAWGTFTVTPTTTGTEKGELYYTDVFNIPLPFTAISEKTVATGEANVLSWLINLSCATTVVSFRLIKSGAFSTTQKHTVKLQITGKWKE